MRNSIFNNTLVEIIAALFIFLFIYTGINKLTEQNSFRVVLAQSPLIALAADFLSLFLPLIELFTAVLLFFPTTRNLGLIISFFLMLIFSGYIGYMVSFTPNLPCSCGGILKRMTWMQHLLFNILFTCLAFFSVVQVRMQRR